jgi:hypothetical protein
MAAVMNDQVHLSMGREGMGGNSGRHRGCAAMDRAQPQRGRKHLVGVKMNGDFLRANDLVFPLL